MDTPVERDFADHDEARDLTGEREEAEEVKAASGELLDLDEKQAAIRALKLFTDQAKRPDRRQAHAQAQVNRWRREGYCNVRVEKVENQSRYKAYMEPGAELVPAFNKLDDLCEKVTNQMFVDPPGPECIPSSGEAEDIESAELAERILRDVQSEDHLDDLTMHREAFDLGHTYGRTYVRYWVDPEGNRVPEQMLAAPGAMSKDAPFTVMVPAPPDPMTGQPAVDPMTGQPAMVPQEMGGPYPLRYVTETGELTDDRAKAAMRWAPRLRSEVLDQRFVRYLPATARSLEDADGVAIGCYRSVAELRNTFKEAMEKLGEEGIRKLVQWQPNESDAKDLWPEGAPKQNDGQDVPLDDRLAFTVSLIYKECPAYEAGAYLCAAGPDVLLHRGPWQGQMPDGTVETLDLPLAEHAKTKRGRKQPVPLAEVLGGLNDQRQIIIAHWLQFLDDFANRAVFVSQYGTVRPEDLEYRNSKYIPYLPGHAPVNEDIPQFPPTTQQLLELTSDDMDGVSGLAQAAQGVEDAGVRSGAHAREIRSAAMVALSGEQQSAMAAYVRGCRIQLQLVRAHFTVPQQIGWTGEDGQYRQRYWSASDLSGTRDVRLKKGTLTMLSAAAKAQEAVYYATVGGDPQKGVPGIISSEELREIIGDRLGADLGLKDNPHRMRVRRQIAAWNDGPPEGWQPPPPVVQQTVMGPQMVPAPDPALTAMWQPLPMDAVPDVAALRYYELSRSMATLRFQSKPTAWQQPYIAEWDRMRRAAGVYTLEEQSQMQQQAAQQQAATAESQRQQQRGEGKADKAEEQNRAAQQKQQAQSQAEAANAVQAEQDRAAKAASV